MLNIVKIMQIKNNYPSLYIFNGIQFVSPIPRILDAINYNLNIYLQLIIINYIIIITSRHVIIAIIIDDYKYRFFFILANSVDY